MTRIVHNELLGGWYVVRGPHQTPISGRFDSYAQAKASLRPRHDYQPKTGQACGCKRGVQRDNCPTCEGTGMVIDFRAIRARTGAGQ